MAVLYERWVWVYRGKLPTLSPTHATETVCRSGADQSMHNTGVSSGSLVYPRSRTSLLPLFKRKDTSTTHPRPANITVLRGSSKTCPIPPPISSQSTKPASSAMTQSSCVAGPTAAMSGDGGRVYYEAPNEKPSPKYFRAWKLRELGCRRVVNFTSHVPNPRYCADTEKVQA